MRGVVKQCVFLNQTLNPRISQCHRPISDTFSDSILGLVPPFVIPPPGPNTNAGVLAPNGVPGLVSPGVAGTLRLCFICAWMRCPAARADMRLSSPAMTAAQMIRARRWAFSPGVTGWAPATPSISSIASWGPRMVPPPTVPTSMEGIEQVMRRSLPSLVLEEKMGQLGWRKGQLDQHKHSRLHQGHTLRTLHILRRILTSSNVHGLRRNSQVSSISGKTSS